RTLLTAAALLALAALTPSAASALELKRMDLEIRVAGEHTVRWNSQTEGYPDGDRGWSKGSGAQTLRFRTRKPIPYGATTLKGALPHGSMPALSLSPLKVAPLTGRVTREAEWTDNVNSCDGEGCGDTGYHPFVPLMSCPERAIGVRAAVAVEPLPGESSSSPQRRLALSVDEAPLDLWEACPPDGELQLGQVPGVALKGMDKVVHLRQGQTVTLTGEAKRGHTSTGGLYEGRCPGLGAPGQQECAVTRVTVTVTRTG
ncbi:MAG TPA: hypothetical protein VIL49_15185, partial [Capillimicrobium sp.]